MIDHSFSKIFAVLRKEFSALTGSLTAWIFLAMFLLLSSFSTFVVSDILESGQADLTPFFHWMPWLFLFVIPALAMPLWSEERRTGTLELSISYPVSIMELVFGKFLAGLCILILALLLTIGTPLTIAYLGKPDLNAILCGYVGAFMAGTIFLAVSCFCSALTRSQTASFLLSVLLCGLLLISGSDVVSNYTALYLPEWLCSGIEKFSMSPHYQAFQRGLLDTGEIAYAILTTGLFIYFTAAALRFTSSGIGGLFLPGALSDPYTWKQILRMLSGIAVAIWLYFCLINTSEIFSARFDLTADKAYSLTPFSKEMVANLQKTVEIRFYISKADGDRFRELEQYAERVEWLLRDMAKNSNGRIRLAVIPLEQWSDEEILARMDGLQPLVKQEAGERFYLGVTISCGANVLPLNNLIPERENLLEYEVIRAIRSVIRENKQKVGILSPLPVMPAPGANNGLMLFAQEMAIDFDLVKLDYTKTTIPDDLEALLIFHPAMIPVETLYAIDQYIMRGGKVIAFVDPRLIHKLSIEDPVARQNFIHSNLGDLMKTWGVRFDQEKSVGDMDYKFIPKALGGEMRVLPRLISIPAEGINTKSGISLGQLSSIHMYYPGALIIDQKPGIKYTPLVTTSANSGLFDIRLQDEEIVTLFSTPGKNAEYKKDLPEKMPLVLHLSGTFPSAFEKAPASVAAKPEEHRSSSAGKPEIVLFADCDMLFQAALVRTELDSNLQHREISNNDNLALLFNVLEHLSGESRLAQLRARKKMSRPLTKLQEERAKIEEEYTARINTLQKSYNEFNRQAEKIRQKIVRLGNRANLSRQEQDILGNQIKREEEFKRDLQASNNRLKERLKEITNKAKLINIVFIPIAILIFGLLLALFRSTKRLRAKLVSAIFRIGAMLIPAPAKKAWKKLIAPLQRAGRKITESVQKAWEKIIAPLQRAEKNLPGLPDFATKSKIWMNWRYYISLLLIALAAWAVLGFAMQRKDIRSREVLPIQAIENLPEFLVQDVKEIELSYGKHAIKLIAGDDAWRLRQTGKPDVIVDPAKILALLEDISKVKLLRGLTMESEKEAAALALSDTVAADNKQLQTLVVLRNKAGNEIRRMKLGKLHYSVGEQIGKYRTNIPDGRFVKIDVAGKMHYFLIDRPLMDTIPLSAYWSNPIACPRHNANLLMIRYRNLTDSKGNWDVRLTRNGGYALFSNEKQKTLDVKVMQSKLGFLLQEPLSRDIASLDIQKNLKPDSRLEISFANGFSYVLEMQNDLFDEWKRYGRLTPSYDPEFTIRLPNESDAAFEKRKQQYQAELEREKKLFGDLVFVMRPNLIEILSAIPEQTRK